MASKDYLLRARINIVMSNGDWSRYTPYALIGAIVFAFMHMADEMAGSWDAGAPGGVMADPTMAAVGVGVILLVSLAGLVAMLTDRTWGYGLAILFGVWALLTGGSHFVNTADMTTFRWAVVALEVGFAAAVLVLATNGLWTRKPWRGRTAAEA